MWVIKGAARSRSDGQVFSHSELRKKIEDHTTSFLESDSLNDHGPRFSYFITDDDMLPVRMWLMKLFSRKKTLGISEIVFNY